MADPFDDPAAAATAEIERLHVFFVGWFRGTLAPEAYDTDFLDHVHPEFEYVMPAGRLLTRTETAESMRGAHGTNPDFDIEIRSPRLLGAFPEARLIHATYDEWQTGAKNSTPPDNLRRSTVLFQVENDRLLWRHIHETALPA